MKTVKFTEKQIEAITRRTTERMNEWFPSIDDYSLFFSKKLDCGSLVLLDAEVLF